MRALEGLAKKQATKFFNLLHVLQRITQLLTFTIGVLFIFFNYFGLASYFQKTCSETCETTIFTSFIIFGGICGIVSIIIWSLWRTHHHKLPELKPFGTLSPEAQNYAADIQRQKFLASERVLWKHTPTRLLGWSFLPLAPAFLAVAFSKTPGASLYPAIRWWSYISSAVLLVVAFYAVERVYHHTRKKLIILDGPASKIQVFVKKFGLRRITKDLEADFTLKDLDALAKNVLEADLVPGSAYRCGKNKVKLVMKLVMKTQRGKRNYSYEIEVDENSKPELKILHQQITQLMQGQTSPELSTSMAPDEERIFLTQAEKEGTAALLGAGEANFNDHV